MQLFFAFILQAIALVAMPTFHLLDTVKDPIRLWENRGGGKRQSLFPLN